MIIIKNFVDYVSGINEGLIKTNPGDKVLKYLLNSIGRMEIVTYGSFEDNKIKLEIKYFNTISLSGLPHLIDHIFVSAVNMGGWFPSIMEITNRIGSVIRKKMDIAYILKNSRDIDNIEITFESKFDEKVENVPDKLYHLSIKEYDKNIKRMGLSTRSQSKLSLHTDRIYLCYNIQDCENLIPQMLKYYSEERDINIYSLSKKLYKKNIEPIIYEIDNSDNKINFLYKDSNYSDGFYTLENINKERIKEVNI